MPVNPLNPLFALLVLAAIVRLIGIDAPLIGVHAWRQADTAAIARNFYENGFNFLYPQVDWGGATAGYCETEFPIYSYLVSWLYAAFGVQEWLGRGLSVVCALIGLWGVYQLAQTFFGRLAAVWAGFFYAMLPLLIYYSRTFQPESMLVMSSVWAVLLFKQWLDSGRAWQWMLSSLAFTVACLIKVLPIASVGLPIAYLAWMKWRWKLFQKPLLWAYGIVAIAAVGLWYGHAHQLFLTYGNTFGFSAGSTNRYTYSLLLTGYFWGELLVKVAVRQFAIFGFFIFLAGLLLPQRHPQEQVLSVWLGAAILGWMAIPTTSVVHEYYQLSFMVPGVIWMGKACAYYVQSDQRWQRRVLLGSVVLTLVASAAFYSADYRAKENPVASPTYQLAQRVKAITAPTAKVIATTGGDPSLLYLAHRQGWLIDPSGLTPAWVSDRAQQGADYLVGSFQFVESYGQGLTAAQQQALTTVLQRYPNRLSAPEFIAPLKTPRG
jgi:4-amino-4-deoxy-L-arabinose transferase-like glycosyltransferase